MNKVIMMGRIVNEPELKTTPQGTLVCSFRIAVDRNFQKKGEERKSDFFNVVAWRNTAEFITRWFGKGRLILIEGEMQTRQYTDKNGNPSTWYEILVDNAYFTGEKASNPQGGANSYGNASGYQNGYQGGNAGGYQGGNAGGYQGNAGGYQGGNAGYSQGGYQSTPQANPMPQQDGANNANNANNGGDGVPGDFKNAKGDTYPF